MSDSMFSKQQHHQKPTPGSATPTSSRIPMPSPTPLRRYGSLRFTTEKQSSSSHPRVSVSPSIGRVRGGGASTQPSLKRGNSFMERGERGHGGGRYSAAAAVVPATNRLHKLTTESRNGSIPAAETPTKGLNTLQSPSRIRSLSLSLSNTRLSAAPKSPSSAQITSSSHHHLISPDARNYSLSTLDWDSESVTSIGSAASCDHATIARNGTTFSGRSMKYVFHCNQHSGVVGEDYLTPTQRAHRQVKKLKYLLQQAKKDLEQKDSDILKLTKEVVELRLYKAALNSPEDKSNSSDAVTVRENSSNETSPEDVDHHLQTNHHHHVISENHCDNTMISSFADSGHFEDGSSVHSKDSVQFEDQQNSPCKNRSATQDKGINAQSWHEDIERNKLIMEYERRLQELVRTHEEESYQLKKRHNDKIEELLQRISEINKKYWEIVPEMEMARERIKELESQLEEASTKLQEQDDHQKEAHSKVQDAEQRKRENVAIELAHQNSNRISVPELLQELQVTKNELDKVKDVEYASSSNNLQPLLSAKEALSLWVLGARKAMYRQLTEAKSKNKIDPEITLQFLKSAVYYFLTDKENSQGHLKAIESILGFTAHEITNIDKARLS